MGGFFMFHKRKRPAETVLTAACARSPFPVVNDVRIPVVVLRVRGTRVREWVKSRGQFRPGPRQTHHRRSNRFNGGPSIKPAGRDCVLSRRGIKSARIADVFSALTCPRRNAPAVPLKARPAYRAECTFQLSNAPAVGNKTIKTPRPRVHRPAYRYRATPAFRFSGP